jgi:hypothetical protein
MALDPQSHRIFLVTSEFTDPGTADSAKTRPQPVTGTATILVVQHRPPAN